MKTFSQLFEGKKEQMMQQIEAVAKKNGHKLHPWHKGRWGFSTNCHECGAIVAITVSRGAQREGERLMKKCKG
jgi:hypothetical protein